MASHRRLVPQNAFRSVDAEGVSAPKDAQSIVLPSKLRWLMCGVAGVGLAFASALSPGVVMAQALPTGGIVTGGQATIGGAGSHLSVQQNSPTAIISWDQFSIGQSNSVHFDNGAGATLNRVRGNVASQIDGSLTATGSVYLVNPAGIAVGSTGHVETGGSFVGSTLEISDEEFGKAARGEAYTVKGSSGASVVNAGRIGSLGGDVALIGQIVENTGEISAKNGTAALAAGSEVLVQDREQDGGRFVVKTGGAHTRVKNTGSIRAAEVELRANGGNVYALAGNSQGVISATGTSARGGRVYLTAGSGGTVEITQRIEARRVVDSASGAVRGGEIRVSARTVKIDAPLDASGRVVNGSAFAGAGIEGDPAQMLGEGGLVLVEGQNIELDRHSLIDVSGTLGGIALVGGDYQGGADVANNYVSERIETAETLKVAEGARIAADGTTGDGGKVVLWSDVQTDFAGEVTAMSVEGHGGDAEVSGKALLAFNGKVDLLGSEGAGTLLLDPYNLTIVAGTGGSATASSNDSTLGADTLKSLLASANTVVSTGASGSQAGNIVVSAAVSWSAATTLTLKAANTIAINAAIAATNGGLTLQAKAGTVAAPTITTSASGAINVGTFFLETGAWVQNSATLPSFAAKDFRLAGGEAVSGEAYAPTVTFLRVAGGSGESQYSAYKVQDVYGLQGMATVRDKSYALVDDIDASTTVNWYGGAGFSPIGSSAGASHFLGNFDGQNHIVKGVTINRPNQWRVGLFSMSFGSINNVGVENASVKGYNSTGGLIGSNSGVVSNVHVTGTVTGTGNEVGGLIGSNYGSINNAYATASVNGVNFIGGLVGSGDGGSYSNVYATGSVTGNGYVGGLAGILARSPMSGGFSLTNAYATGAVTGTGDNVGGLVGQISGAGNTSSSISNVYATGAVKGSKRVGGLAGYMITSGSLSVNNAYATGAVTGTASVGGLVGEFTSGTITSSFWDVDLTGHSSGAGTGTATGITGIRSSTGGSAFTQATYAGWNFASSWYMVDGETRPFLRMDLNEFGKTYDAAGREIAGVYTIRNANQLQLIKSHEGTASKGKTYILANDIDLTAALASGHWRAEATKDGDNLYGFVPIGSQSKLFQGAFDGAGHVISGLTINRPTRDEVGLFGAISNYAAISNTGITGGTITGKNYVGGLVGQSSGKISVSYASGSVNGAGMVGGLVGANGSSIISSYATGAVTATGSRAGGLVGENNGTISTSYASGNATGVEAVGGLVGANNGTIADAYATGKASATGDKVGGLVGQMIKGSVARTYAKGIVTLSGANLNKGGLIGLFGGGTVTSSFWNTTGAGQVTKGVGTTAGGNISGIQGLKDTDFKDTDVFMSKAVGWNFNSVWVPPADVYDPEFYALSKVIRVHSNVGLDGVTYGASTVSVDNTKLSQNTVIYGVGVYAKDDAAYDKNSAAFNFGTQANYNIGVLNAGAQVVSLAATGRAATDQGFRIVYTSNIAVAKKAITLDINAEKTYDTNAWTGVGFTPTLDKDSKLAFSENLASLGVISLSGAGVGAVNAGNYSLGVSFDNSGTASNYAITYTNRSLTVAKAQLVVGTVTSTFNISGSKIAAADLTREYDGTKTFAYKDAKDKEVNYIDSYAYSIAGTDFKLSLNNLAYDQVDAGVAGTQVVGQWRIVSVKDSKGGYNTSLASNYTLVDALSKKDDNSFAVAATITAKTISYSDPGKQLIKTYDGTTDVTKDGSIIQTIAGAGNQRLTVTLSGLKYASADAGATVGVTGAVSITGGAGSGYKISNYKLASSSFAENGKIEQAVINLSGLKVNPNKTYDGSDVFALANQEVNGVNNEKVYVSLTNAKYKDANAGITSVAGTWGIASASSAVGNYKLAQTSYVNKSVTISKAKLNIEDLGLILDADKTYDGSSVFSYADQAILTGVGGESLKLSLSKGRYSSADAGVRTVSGLWGLSDGAGGLAKNYQLSNANLSLKNVTIARAKIDAATINAAIASISANKVYDGRNQFTPAPVAGIGTGTNGEALTIRLQNGRYSDVNAGSTLVTGTWGIASVTGGNRKGSNYELETPAFSLAATIAAKTIDLSKQTFRADKTYDGLDGFTLASRQISTGVGSERVTLDLLNGKYSTPNAGNATVTGTWQARNAASGAGLASNYVLVNSAASVDTTIKQAYLNLSKFTELQFNANKTYDGLSSFNFTPVAINTGVNGETLSASLLNGAYTSADAGGTRVTGEWGLGNASGLFANYKIVGAAISRGATISKAALTVTADDVTASYTGQKWAGAGGAVSYSGFVNGESASALGGTLNWRSPGNVRDIGTYTITPSGLTSRNYQLTYVAGVLTIQP